MRLIDADTVVHWQSYDDEHETYPEHDGTIAEFLDAMTDEGCPESVSVLPSAQPVNIAKLQPNCNQVASDCASDCISRQATIAEIMEDIKDRSLHDDPATPEDYAEGYDEGIRNAAAIVLQMPSAQPDVPDTNVGDMISREAAIEAMRKAKDKSELHRMLVQLPSAQPGWIPVTERLPEDDRPVLVTLKWSEDDYEVTTGEYWRDSTVCHGWGNFGNVVIAWQPLPTPYREGGQDE